MTKRKFPRSELKRHLENMENFWDLDEDESLEELIGYVNALYKAVPESRRDLFGRAAEVQIIRVDLKELDQLLYRALNPAFSEAGVAEELRSFASQIVEAGGNLQEDELSAPRQTVREVFDQRYSIHVLSDDIVPRLDPVREFLTI